MKSQQETRRGGKKTERKKKKKRKKEKEFKEIKTKYKYLKAPEQKKKITTDIEE